MGESLTTADGVDAGLTELEYVGTLGAFGTEQFTGTPGFIYANGPTSIPDALKADGINTPGQYAAVAAQGVATDLSAAKSAIGSVIPSETTIVEGIVAVVVVLVLILLILGKVEAL